MVCSLYGARFESSKVPEYTADIHPRLTETDAYVRHNIRPVNLPRLTLQAGARYEDLVSL